MKCPFCKDFQENSFSRYICQYEFQNATKYKTSWYCTRLVGHRGPHVACKRGLQPEHLVYISPNKLILKFNKGKELESQS